MSSLQKLPELVLLFIIIPTLISILLNIVCLNIVKTQIVQTIRSENRKNKPTYENVISYRTKEALLVNSENGTNIQYRSKTKPFRRMKCIEDKDYKKYFDIIPDTRGMVGFRTELPKSFTSGIILHVIVGEKIIFEKHNESLERQKFIDNFYTHNTNNTIIIDAALNFVFLMYRNNQDKKQCSIQIENDFYKCDIVAFFVERNEFLDIDDIGEVWNTEAFKSLNTNKDKKLLYMMVYNKDITNNSILMIKDPKIFATNICTKITHLEDDDKREIPVNISIPLENLNRDPQSYFMLRKRIIQFDNFSDDDFYSTEFDWVDNSLPIVPNPPNE